jgi:ABC-type enterochelin transport system substrate-binding protein
MSLTTAGLSHRTCASAATTDGNSCNQGYNIRKTRVTAQNPDTVFIIDVSRKCS